MTVNDSDAKRVVIGARIHSGWSALVAVSNRAGTVEIAQKLRVSLAAEGMPGAYQPYHFAKNLEFPEAEKFLRNVLAASTHLALSAVRDVMDDLTRHQYQLVGVVVLRASGRPLPSLSKILASHALIHAAEGEFFREAMSTACERVGLPVAGLPERSLDEHIQAAFDTEAPRIRKQVAALGGSVGPPWTKDQKLATLAALVVLATGQGNSEQAAPNARGTCR